MQNKTLSICIPTYNRAKSLDRILENIFSETDDIRQEIEVCISDNASENETEAVVEKWKRVLSINYNKNNQNLGFDINLLKVTQLATGSYLWYSGDDDIFDKGAIKKVVGDLKKIVKKEEVGAIYIAGKKHKRYNRLEFEGLRLYQIYNNVPFLDNLSFMGCFCVNKIIVMDILEKDIKVIDGKIIKTKYKAPVLDAFMHTFLFLECAWQSKYIGVISGYGICGIADGNEFTYKRHIYFVLLHMEYLLHLKKYYGELIFVLSSQRYNLFIRSFLLYFLLYSVLFSQQRQLESFYQLQYFLLCLLCSMLQKKKRGRGSSFF